MALPKFPVAATVLAASVIANADELPKGATLLDPDIVWDLEPEPDPSSGTRDPTFAISPDDKSIAYISKGGVWKCDVTTGLAQKLADLPNTITAMLATPDNRAAWIEMKKAQPWADRHIQVSKLPRAAVGVHSLAWTSNQDGVVFTLSEGTSERPWTVRYRVMHASSEGVVTPIAKFQRDGYDEPHHLTCFAVTRDKRHVISTNGYTPLIWDTATNKPRATPFDVLIPSATSDRLLGIEIDTRQLVIADANFKVAKRFDATFTPKRFCDLVWSRDERFAICRERLEHPSDEWVGFRIDLRNGTTRELSGSHMLERCVFTGAEGELVRIPPRYGRVTGMKSISLVPDGDEPQQELIAWPILPPSTFPSNFGRYPRASMSRDGQLFALAFTREDRLPGYRFFLVDREGQMTDIAPDDPSTHISPYNVIAIVNRGQTILACDDTRLFSVPVEAIKNARSANDK
jgi:hypothetical protein